MQYRSLRILTDELEKLDLYIFKILCNENLQLESNIKM